MWGTLRDQFKPQHFLSYWLVKSVSKLPSVCLNTSRILFWNVQESVRWSRCPHRYPVCPSEALEWMEQIKTRKPLKGSDSPSARHSLNSDSHSCHQDMMHEITLTQSCNSNGHWCHIYVGSYSCRHNEKWRWGRLEKQTVGKDGFGIDKKFSTQEWKNMLYREIKSGSSNVGDGQTFFFTPKVTYRAGSREEVVMAGLRRGHVHLNSTLNVTGKHPSGLCSVCQ